MSDDDIMVGVPMGESLVCDTCNKDISDKEHKATEPLFQVSYGLVCSDCYNTTFRPEVEHGNEKLLMKYAKGEFVDSTEFLTCTAIINCSKCGLIIRDLGMLSKQQAEIATRTCHVCGRKVES